MQLTLFYVALSIPALVIIEQSILGFEFQRCLNQLDDGRVARVLAQEATELDAAPSRGIATAVVEAATAAVGVVVGMATVVVGVVGEVTAEVGVVVGVVGVVTAVAALAILLFVIFPGPLLRFAEVAAAAVAH